MGESEIIKRIYKWEERLPKTIKLAYLPSFGRVRMRLSSKGKEKMKVEKAVDLEMRTLHCLLEDIAIGYEEETSLVQRIANVFIQKEETLSLSESCTGGAITNQITALAGVSAFFIGSTVPYATKSKSTVLGVNKKLVEDYSVVSKEVAEAMAVQSQKLFNTNYAVSTTGIAGPTQGDSTDEVGTVFIAIAGPKGVYSEKYRSIGGDDPCAGRQAGSLSHFRNRPHHCRARRWKPGGPLGV